MNTKAAIRQAVITAVAVAAVAYASRQSDAIRNVTGSESGQGFFGRLLSWVGLG